MSLDLATLQKMAAALQEAEARPSAAKVLGKSLLGLGGGITLGYGGMKGIEALRGKPISPQAMNVIVPLATGMLGMTAPFFQHGTLQRMREDHLKRQKEKGHERQES